MLKKTISLAVLSLATISSSYALDVTVNNEADASVSMAFSYLDSNTQKWVVDGWYNVEAKAKSIINLNTDNGIYYLYAEFSNGKKIEGGESSVHLYVKPSEFLYSQDETLHGNKFQARFVRAKSDGKVALININ